MKQIDEQKDEQKDEQIKTNGQIKKETKIIRTIYKIFFPLIITYNKDLRNTT